MEKQRKELGKNVRLGIIVLVFSCFTVFAFVAQNLLSYMWLTMVAVHLVHSYMHFTGLTTFEGSLQTNLVFVSISQRLLNLMTIKMRKKLHHQLMQHMIILNMLSRLPQSVMSTQTVENLHVLDQTRSVTLNLPSPPPNYAIKETNVKILVFRIQGLAIIILIINSGSLYVQLLSLFRVL